MLIPLLFCNYLALDDLEPDIAFDFLLHCSPEHFIAVIDLVAKENQGFYTAEWTYNSAHDELMEQVNDSISAFLDEKPSLSEKIHSATCRSKEAILSSLHQKDSAFTPHR